MINTSAKFFHHPMPHHPAPHHPVPPHEHHRHRHSLVSIVYDNDAMQAAFGELWPFHLEAIADESPEMKILFALSMGFKVNVNQQIAQVMIENRKEEPEYDFSNPALSDEVYSCLEQRLGISNEVADVILGTTPPGIISVIVSMLDR